MIAKMLLFPAKEFIEYFRGVYDLIRNTSTNVGPNDRCSPGLDEYLYFNIIIIIFTVLS